MIGKNLAKILLDVPPCQLLLQLGFGDATAAVCQFHAIVKDRPNYGELLEYPQMSRETQYKHANYSYTKNGITASCNK
jgi:hypothetical protein